MPIKVSSFIMQGASLEGENPLPFFRAREHNLYPTVVELFPDSKKELLGYETAFRVLPYRMQDRYSRRRHPIYFKQIILENDLIEAVFLPEFGGRLYSLRDKKTGRDILYRNSVFQPANLAIRNAWLSGGIEWNIGQIGHTFTTCSPVYVARVKDENEGDFLRIYEFERCKKVFWKLDFHLPSGSNMLYVYTSIVNPSDESVPMYWWTNIAVEESEGMRVFAPADEVIYINPAVEQNNQIDYGVSRMPILPSLPDKDSSYPWNFNFSNEYFFQVPDNEKAPWEAAVYENGRMFFETSTSMLRYRKMFCWGNHAGGRRWKEYLSVPGEGSVEIQGGLAPTQLHGMDMPAHTVWEWTQVFGISSVDRDKAHQKDWFAARSIVEEKIRRLMPCETLYNKHSYFQECSLDDSLEILHDGSGWGALELLRMRSAGKRIVLDGFMFPLSSIGPEQYPWLCLLNTGTLPETDICDKPVSWMIQRDWEVLLKKSIENPQNRNWNALLHYGVMLYEKGREEEAVVVWKESLEKCPSAWVYRNMAVAEKNKGNLNGAIEYMEKALQFFGEFCDQSFAEEYISLLNDKKNYDKAWEYYKGLPDKLASAERIRIMAGVAALETDHLDFVAGIFEHEYAVIREGEVLLTELWFKYNAKMLAKQRGITYSSELIEECKKLYPPPRRIDYRQY